MGTAEAIFCSVFTKKETLSGTPCVSSPYKDCCTLRPENVYVSYEGI